MPSADKRARQKEGRAVARAERVTAYKRTRRRQMIVRALVVAVMIGLVFGVISFLGRDDGNEDDEAASDDTSTTQPVPTPVEVSIPEVEGCDLARVPEEIAERPTFDAPPALEIDPAKQYTAVLDTTCGPITIELEAAAAPNTVNNFVFLALQGFYDGLTFHRVVEDFVVQGGDPNGDGTGGPGYQFDDENLESGYPAGAVVMANSGPNTNGSQFFVVVGDEGGAGLQPSFSKFGQVTEGMHVIERLEQFADPNANPADPTTQVTVAPLYIFSVSITESDPNTAEEPAS